MIYPEISIEDIKKWNKIGGKDASILIDDKRVYLDEDQYSFGMFLSLLDRETTAVVRPNKFKTTEELTSYYQGKIDQLIDSLASGIFNEDNAKVMAVPLSRFSATFSHTHNLLPYAIQYMLRLNGFEIKREVSIKNFAEKYPKINVIEFIPVSPEQELYYIYGKKLNEKEMKHTLSKMKIYGEDSNIDYLLNLSAKQKA